MHKRMTYMSHTRMNWEIFDTSALEIVVTCREGCAEVVRCIHAAGYDSLYIECIKTWKHPKVNNVPYDAELRTLGHFGAWNCHNLPSVVQSFSEVSTQRDMFHFCRISCQTEPFWPESSFFKIQKWAHFWGKFSLTKNWSQVSQEDVGSGTGKGIGKRHAWFLKCSNLF